jgi:hypothetical protein
MPAAQCSTCHSGAYVSQNAQMKPTTHIATTAQCSTCHNSTTTWANGSFNHSSAVPAVAGRCSTCHNSVNALGKPSNHVPTTTQCDTCHTNFTAFAPAQMNHAGTNGKCSTCHGGSYTTLGADAKPGTHIPTTQSCDICHTTVQWKPTSFSHTGVAPGSCATCHNGTNAAGKSVPHIPTTQSCDVCHRTGIAWLPLITPYAHAGVAAGTCSTCHVSSYPEMEYKPANHIPTTASCDACHKKTTWMGPYTFNHAGAVSCQSCHDVRYTGIVAKPANHIPTTLAGLLGNECSNCHSSTTSFTVERMNHGAMQTGCATCHSSTATYMGSMEKIRIGSHEGSRAGNDCSMAGCHKPLGRKGTPYSKWD